MLGIQHQKCAKRKDPFCRELLKPRILISLPILPSKALFLNNLQTLFSSCVGELIHDSFHKKTSQAYFTSPWRGD
ncbi:hypothetical protein I308_104003 [Cryptococcus tetragattii IND107]|uniref:Uncharacterized protein n=1 Tax=Cryptococcus tetragattii IND107 TaxID=1296105 RepID=A0ABR3BRX8_9TREE